MDTAPLMAKRDQGTFIRFLVAGGLNTLFGWMIYSLALIFGAHVWLALLSSTLIGIAFNFLSLGGYAFRDLSVQRLPRFVASYLLVYLLNLALISSLQTLIQNAIWAQLALIPIMAALSYLIMSRWVFKKPIEISSI